MLDTGTTVGWSILWHLFMISMSCLDSELTMKTHILKVVSSCYHQLCRIRMVCQLVRQDVAQQLVLAFILSWLDYCNSLLSLLPWSAIQSLQLVMNAAARVVMNLLLCDHVKPALKQFTLAASWAKNYVKAVSVYAPHPHRTSTTILVRLLIHSFCSQWQMPVEVDWLRGLRSAKSKN